MGARMGDYGQTRRGTGDPRRESVTQPRRCLELSGLGRGGGSRSRGVPRVELKSRLLGPGGGARRQYAWDSRVRLGTPRAGRGTPDSLGFGCEIWAVGSPGMKKGIQDLGEARRGVPGVGAAWQAGPGSYLPGPRRLRAELGCRRDVGWGGGTGRGPWRRPGPGSVAPEPCLRRSRGLRVSRSGLGAGDPPPSHSLTALYPLK